VLTDHRYSTGISSNKEWNSNKIACLFLEYACTFIALDMFFFFLVKSTRSQNSKAGITLKVCTCSDRIRIEMRVKVKGSRYRPGVAQRVGRRIALLFHDRGNRRE